MKDCQFRESEQRLDLHIDFAKGGELHLSGMRAECPHYVGRARAQADLSGVSRVGLDETASRRGHHYISVFVDLDRAKVVHVAPGQDGDTVASFAEDLVAHGGEVARVKEVCLDMSPAFQAGVREHLPQARITFDRFHVTRLLNQAVDQVRREEQRQRAELKRTRYL